MRYFLPSLLLISCFEQIPTEKQTDEIEEEEIAEEFIDADGDGYSIDEGDCDDDFAAVYPFATDMVGDGIDQNCDGVDGSDGDQDGYASVASGGTDCDDENAEVVPDDADGDGFTVCDGDCDDSNAELTPVDGDEDGVTLCDGDCDDANPAAQSVDAEEACDGADNNCDGVADEGVLGMFYADADGDGFGDSEAMVEGCDAPDGHVEDATDCDDGNEAAHDAAADEICDGADNNCDGAADEGVLGTYYADLDGDGYGDAATLTEACEAPEGYIEEGTDCDDSEALAFSADAAEDCDGVDNNCDGSVDEGVLTTFYADADGDGFGDAATATDACEAPDGYIEEGTDCDDSEALAFSTDASEDCDGVDNNCNGGVDEGATTEYFADADGDGYGDPATATDACEAPDAYIEEGTDCDDSEALAYSTDASEDCDGVDNNCDGAVDEGTIQTYYADLDGDGYGDAEAAMESCGQPEGYVSDATDCNDGEPGAHDPDASEDCDGIDNNCDGTVDEGATTDFYADLDGDGYGDPASVIAACELADGLSTYSSDCDDGSDSTHPGAAEREDDLSLCMSDADGDGYGHSSPASGVSEGQDCDDGMAAINPLATDILGDGYDQNCDGTDGTDSDGDGEASEASGGDDCDDDDSSVTSLSDGDGDGFSFCTGDCDDTDADSNPNGNDIPDDGIDQDCDGYDFELGVFFGDIDIIDDMSAAYFCANYSKVYGDLHIRVTGLTDNETSLLECLTTVSGQLQTTTDSDSSITLPNLSSVGSLWIESFNVLELASLSEVGEAAYIGVSEEDGEESDGDSSNVAGLELEWGDEELSLSIDEIGPDESLRFGIGLADGGWSEEDCFNNDCHEVDSDGTLSLQYGWGEEYEHGQTTIFWQEYQDYESMFYLIVDDNSEQCWTWGPYTSEAVYWGCTDLNEDGDAFANRDAVYSGEDTDSEDVDDNGSDEVAASLDISALEAVGDNLYVRHTSDVDLGALNSVGESLYAIHAGALDIDALSSVDSLSISTSDGGSISASSLEEVNGTLYIEGGSTHSFPALTSVASSFSVHPDSGILDGDTSFPVLLSVGYFSQEGGSALSELQGFNSLTSAYQLSFNSTELMSVDGFESLETVNSLTFEWNESLYELPSFDALVSAESITISGNHSLENLPSFNSLETAESINFYYNTTVTDFTGLSSLVTVNYLYWQDNYSLTSISGLESLESLEYLSIQNNESLSSVTGFDSFVWANGLEIGNNYSLATTEICTVIPLEYDWLDLWNNGDEEEIEYSCDIDGDGYNMAEGDCDDSDASVNPADNDGDGQSNCDGDCDDTDPTVYSGYWTESSEGDTAWWEEDMMYVDAPEEIYYDGIDQNCDGWSDYDADWDGQDSSDYGGEDCDDEDGEKYIGAEEYCDDGIDQDCDGLDDISEDLDGDGWSSCAGDCDRENADINPNAEEVYYDGVDQNCDGWDDYDMDGDGYASAEYEGDDCDDGNGDIHPDATELCSQGQDMNCDGELRDEDQCQYYYGDVEFYWEEDDGNWLCEEGYSHVQELRIGGGGSYDFSCIESVEHLYLDGDGFGTIDFSGLVSVGNLYVGAWWWGYDFSAEEIRFDRLASAEGIYWNNLYYPGMWTMSELTSVGDIQIENNYDLWSLDAFSSVESVGYLQINDNYSLSTYETCSLVAASNGNYDVWSNGNWIEEEYDPSDICDSDGDGYTMNDGDCDDTDASISPEDADGDGQSVCDGDCDDGNASINSGAWVWYSYGGDTGGWDTGWWWEEEGEWVWEVPEETYYNGIDENCDGWSDFDADWDGQDAADYGGDDCDDEDEGRYLGAEEICDDEVDQDCDGLDSLNNDADEDGYGACDGDCDDFNADVYPDAEEEWYDGIDQNCDGADDYDYDGDGFSEEEDCNDQDSDIYPGKSDICNDGIDQDCDGEDQEECNSYEGDYWIYSQEDADWLCENSYSYVDYLYLENVDGQDIDLSCIQEVYEFSYQSCGDSMGELDLSSLANVWDQFYLGCSFDAERIDLSSLNYVSNFNLHDTYLDGDEFDFGDGEAHIDYMEMYWNYEFETLENLEQLTYSYIQFEENYNLDAEEYCPILSQTDGYYLWMDNDWDGNSDMDGDWDGYDVCDDCDDDDESINPDGQEICDGVDNDCDELVDGDDDDLDLSEGVYVYIDGDGDGWGDNSDYMAWESCTPPAGYATNNLDCDDADADFNLDDADGDGWSTCDGDCSDENADSVWTDTYYMDADGDGYGDNANYEELCGWMPGYVENNDDCDDTDAGKNWGTDDDGDGHSSCSDCDDSNWSIGATDEDGDGWSACPDDPADCDDNNGSIYPGSTWISIEGNGQDVDASCVTGNLDYLYLYGSFGDVDFSGVTSISGDLYLQDSFYATSLDFSGVTELNYISIQGTSLTDIDEDSFSGLEWVGYTYAEDNPSLATEDLCSLLNNSDDWSVYNNGWAVGGEDDEDEVCDLDQDGSIAADCDTRDASLNQQDLDGDIYTTCDGDCDDEDPDVYPNAEEVFYDDVDQNCDGLSDFDADMDGHADAEYGGDDCDDDDPTVRPSTDEICADGVDNNCDGVNTLDVDEDGDGYSDCDGDCDDLNDEVHPGTEEIYYDGVDADCDGADDYDADGDGYVPSDYAELSELDDGDCEDEDRLIHPNAGEICSDGIDQDCDGEDRDGCLYSSDWWSIDSAEDAEELCDANYNIVSGLEIYNSGGAVEDYDLSCINSVRYLYFQGGEIGTVDLSGLTTISEYMNTSNSYGDLSFENVLMPRLETLENGNMNFNDSFQVEGLLDLSGLKEIEELNFSDGFDAGEIWLHGLETINYLYIEYTNLTGSELKLRDLESISEYLYIYDNNEMTEVFDLPEDAEIEYFYIRYNDQLPNSELCKWAGHFDSYSIYSNREGSYDTPNWYDDADGDGYGYGSSFAQQCENPGGYVDNAYDCLDSDYSVHPYRDMDEDGYSTCDDCNDSDETIGMTDEDGDGYSGCSVGGLDCDDSDPDSTSVANDGDCDGSLSADDCDDSDPLRSPLLDEVCEDGIDNDCDGAEVDSSCWEGPAYFTNCDVSDQYGPDESSCINSYSGTVLDGEITVSAGIQAWSIPTTAVYTIEALGAEGGYNDDGCGDHVLDHAYGARIQGSFQLTQGDTLYVVVGTQPTRGGGNGCNGGMGGGGGTFVFTEGGLLLAAGGGGGSGLDNQSTLQTQSGKPGTSSEAGTASWGGYSPSTSPMSGGIAGGNGSGEHYSGGLGWVHMFDGIVGGDFSGRSGYNYGNVGGFGGGGGDKDHYAGGGGGYSGGGGAPSSYGYGGGGGGGSYNSADDPVNEENYNSGHGEVNISTQ
jgi:hypothetical protein